MAGIRNNFWSRLYCGFLPLESKATPPQKDLVSWYLVMPTTRICIHVVVNILHCPVSCWHTFFGCSPTLPPSPSTPKGEKGDFIRTPPLLDISQLIAATEDDDEGEVTVAIKRASEPDSVEGCPLKSGKGVLQLNMR